MIDFLGFALSLVLFFVLALVAAVVYVLVAYLLLMGRPRWHRSLAFGAGLIPLLCSVQMLTCWIVFCIFVPHQGGELFGDISEPLPNGYRLEALGKMNDMAHITPHGPDANGHVERIAVEGSRVLGQFNSHVGPYPFSSQRPTGYFALETKTGVVTDFTTKEQLDKFIGYQVELVENQFFRSQEPSQKRLRFLEGFVAFGPLTLLTIGYLVMLLWTRRLTDARGSTQRLRPASYNE